MTQLLDDALKEYQAAQDALKVDDLAGYKQHIQKMVADLQQADQLEHLSATIPSGPSPPGQSPIAACIQVIDLDRRGWTAQRLRCSPQQVARWMG